MTDLVNPSRGRTADSFQTSGAIAYGGHGDDGFIIDSANPTDLSSQNSNITEGNFNNFQESSSASSFDVTIDPGEGFIYGSWVAIDTSTTVTLASQTNNQTVYVGWDRDTADDVIVGLDSAFASTGGDTDKKIPLWDFDTDGSGVTSVTDRRQIGFSQASTAFTGDIELLPGSDLTDGTNTIYDRSAGYVPQARLQNDSLTITAGDGLKNGGTVSLGGSTTVDIEPADFAGTGVEDDGSDNLRVDEDASLTWTSDQTFNGGITAGANFDLSGNNVNDIGVLALQDRDSDGNFWQIFEDNGSGHLNISSNGGGGTMVDVERNGDVRIQGTLTENASL